ncbi:non-specific lipid-transfer protein 1-like [Vigna unguiculata]|uniref:non-specific lipid-transfer protein 1-like n=1 Tax=Vigna unguiculata TaxID=3917 RepID=UPI001016B57F|nr:non-specific lipid-transfer protein 1-like [Vigna unguiculata]
MPHSSTHLLIKRQKRMAVTKVALVASMMACMLITCSYGQTFLTCNQIAILLYPCVPSAIFGVSVPSLCCQGIIALNAAYRSVEDRRRACQCIKDRAARINGINYDLINEIPGICGSRCPFTIYPSTNCSAVQ